MSEDKGGALMRLAEAMRGLEGITADDLKLVISGLDDLRLRLLVSDGIHEGSFGSLSEPDYLQGLCFIEQARLSFTRAATFRAGEIAGRF